MRKRSRNSADSDEGILGTPQQLHVLSLIMDTRRAVVPVVEKLTFMERSETSGFRLKQIKLAASMWMDLIVEIPQSNGSTKYAVLDGGKVTDVARCPIIRRDEQNEVDEWTAAENVGKQFAKLNSVTDRRHISVIFSIVFSDLPPKARVLVLISAFAEKHVSRDRRHTWHLPNYRTRERTSIKDLREAFASSKQVELRATYTLNELAEGTCGHKLFAVHGFEGCSSIVEAGGYREDANPANNVCIPTRVRDGDYTLNFHSTTNEGPCAEFYVGFKVKWVAEKAKFHGFNMPIVLRRAQWNGFALD